MKNIKNLARLLEQAPETEWEGIAKEILLNPKVSARLLGHLFPKSTSYLRKGNRPDLMSLDKELIWAATLCNAHANEVNRFIAARDEIDALILSSRFDDALRRISSIELDVGISYWLVEVRLGTFAMKGDMDALAEYFQKLSNDQRNAPLIVNLLIGVSWLRCALKSSEASYLDIVASVEVEIKKRSQRDAKYFRFKSAMWSLSANDLEDITEAMNGEANSPIIDRYVTLLRACGFIVAMGQESYYPTILRVFEIMSGIKSVEHDQFTLSLTSIEQYCGPVSSTFGKYANGDYEDSAIELSENLKDEKGLIAGHLIHSQVLAATVRDSADDEIELRDRICRKFQSVLSRSEECEEAIEELKRLARRFSLSSWSATLSSRLRAEVEVETPWGKRQFNSRLHAIYLPIGDHVKLRYCSTALFEKLVQRIDSLSPLYKIEVMMRLGGVADESLLLTAIHDDEYRCYRHAWWDYSRGAADEARGGFESLCDSENRNIRVKSRIFFLQLISENHVIFVCKCVQYFLENRSILRAVNLKRFVESYQELDSFDELRLMPELSVLLHVYDRTDGLVRKREIADALEDLLVSHCVDSPIGLSDDIFVSRRSRIFFLAYVCVPDNREGSIHLPTQESVYQERIKICEELVQLDPGNEKRYRAESVALVELLAVRKFLARYNGAKIHVDEKNIRRLFENDGRIYFDAIRHQSKLLPEKLELYDRDRREPSVQLGGNIDYYILHRPYSAFGSLFFLEKRYGLNTSISVFIKHGIIDGKIKSSMSRNGLTLRSLNDTLMKVEDYSNVAESLTRCVKRFSSQVEQQIRELKTVVLQTKSDSNPNGLLDYSAEVSSSIVTTHIVLLSQNLNERMTFDDFCHMLLNQHWERTNLSLKAIRNHLSEIFKNRINSCYDELVADVKLNAPEALSVVRNQVFSAKAAWSRDLLEVVSWFEKGKALEYEDFRFSRVVQAALENTAALYPDVRFIIKGANHSNSSFKGHYFAPFLTVVNLIFENVVSYSGSRTPIMRLDAKDVEDVLWVRVENDLIRLSDDELSQRKAYLVGLLASLKDGEYFRKVDGDKNSGIPKIKKLITSDLNCDVEIVADYSTNELFHIELAITCREILA